MVANNVDESHGIKKYKKQQKTQNGDWPWYWKVQTTPNKNKSK